MNKLILLSITLVLGACGTTGAINPAQLHDPMVKDAARIVVTRDNSLLYMAGSAIVKSNGTQIAGLGRGGSIVHDIPKGKNVLSVSTPTAFGKFVVNFNAKEGEVYNFRISPRGSKLITGSLFGVIGDAVSAEVSEQTGYFKLELVGAGE